MPQMRGVYPILVTPFDERERVDVDSLQNLVEFELAAGVHGLGVALGNEVFKLTEEERVLVTRTVVDQVRGRVPVVINSGGEGGSYFIEEMRRGSVGTMPGCCHPEAFVQVWDRFQAGDEQGAYEVFYQRILPISRVSAQGWGAFYHTHKAILRQRGAIRTDTVRGPVAPLDEATQRDLQAVIDKLYPHQL